LACAQEEEDFDAFTQAPFHHVPTQRSFHNAPASLIGAFSFLSKNDRNYCPKGCNLGAQMVRSKAEGNLNNHTAFPLRAALF
jgi:hypothetical protein